MNNNHVEQPAPTLQLTAVLWQDLFLSKWLKGGEAAVMSPVHIMARPSDRRTLCGAMAHEYYCCGVGECVYIPLHRVGVDAGALNWCSECAHILTGKLRAYGEKVSAGERTLISLLVWRVFNHGIPKYTPALRKPRWRKAFLLGYQIGIPEQQQRLEPA